MRVLIIVNTRSGGPDTGLYRFVRILGDNGYEIVLRYVTEDVRIESLLSDANSFDRIVAAGGDGTAAAVCYAARYTGVPVLPFPAGTANLLSLNLNLPIDAPALAQTLMTGVPVEFDIGELEQGGAPGTSEPIGFAVAAGAGYDASIMDAAQSLKPAFGATAYLMAALSTLTPTISDFELVLDGQHISTSGIAVLLVNFGRIQFDLDLTRGWDAQDGLFDVAVIKSKNVAELIPAAISSMWGRGGESSTGSSGIDIFTASNVEVSAYPPLRMQYDGEVLDQLTPFAARVLPKASTLIVPKDSPFAGTKRADSEG